jgi:hypothetical protein
MQIAVYIKTRKKYQLFERPLLAAVSTGRCNI